MGGLYKRFFHFKALVYESVILLLHPPPHTRTSRLVPGGVTSSLTKGRGGGRSEGGLYKRFFYFKALVYEPIVLLLSPLRPTW